MRRTRPLPTAAVALSLCLGLAACGSESAEPGASPTAPSPTSTATPPAATAAPAPPTDEDDTMRTSEPRPSISPEPPEGGLPVGPVPDAVAQRDDVQQAVAAEAERRGVPAEQVTVAGYADVTWRDGSIGCPQPGMMYTQALVPGHQLVLEVDGDYASYHAAQGKPFSYCAEPQAPTEGGGTTDM